MHAPVRPGFWAGRLNRANAKSIYLPEKSGKEAKIAPTLFSLGSSDWALPICITQGEALRIRLERE